MRKPFISIIIPTLNEEKFLPHLLKSLVSQTISDYEVLVVDGQSVDKTIEKANSFSSQIAHLRIIKADRAGLPYQRNIGAKAAQGKWLAFIDADSVLLPYFVERCRIFIRKQRPSIFTTWCQADSEVANDAVIALLANMTFEGSLIFKRPFAPGPLSVVKKEVFDVVGGYDENLGFAEDYDFSAKVYEHGFQMKILRESLYKWSLRRMRNQGKMRVFRTYAQSALWVLINKRGPKNVSGYLMGGHLYREQTQKEKSLFKKYEERLRSFIQEFIS